MLDDKTNVLTDLKIQTLAKSIENESKLMGFSSGDYVKLMNQILTLGITENQNHTLESQEITYLNKSKPLPIMGKSVKIREYRSKMDKNILANWIDDEIGKLFLLSTNSANFQELDKIINDENNILGIITLNDETPIGAMAILNIDKKNKKGEMRKLIGEDKYRGKGFAKEASHLWIDYCIDILGLNKIYINTIDTNIKNISLNRQLGFQIEGLLKNECIIDDIPNDVIRMAYFKKS